MKKAKMPKIYLYTYQTTYLLVLADSVPDYAGDGGALMLKSKEWRNEEDAMSYKKAMQSSTLAK